MPLKKQVLGQIDHCYAVTAIQIDGREKFIFAPDDWGPCVAIDAQTLEKETVWEKPGGTMSMIPFQKGDIQFLASQNFFPGFCAAEASVVCVCRANGHWTSKPWLKMPYLHRFDILESGGRTWFLGCILSGDGDGSADFHKAGRLVVGEIEDGIHSPRTFTTIADGMHKNHGYCRTNVNGEEYILTACEEGVFRVKPPCDENGEWNVSRLIDVPASDAAICDLDGDGRLEILVISPFHGDRAWIYKEDENEYRREYEIKHESSFLHAIWAGSLAGQPTALLGGRSGAMETLCVRSAEGTYQINEIERGFGASNFCVTSDRILAANRERGECALFTFVNDENQKFVSKKERK